MSAAVVLDAAAFDVIDDSRASDVRALLRRTIDNGGEVRCVVITPRRCAGGAPAPVELRLPSGEATAQVRSSWCAKCSDRKAVVCCTLTARLSKAGPAVLAGQNQTVGRLQ